MAAGDPIALLRGARNVRRFRSDPVPEAALASVLEIARWTGSAGNGQPWQFVVVRDPATIRSLAATGPNLGWAAEAPLAIVPVLDGEAKGTEAFDEGRLAERLMLAARAQGLGAGLGWFLSGEARAAAKRILDVPAERSVRTIVAIGTAAAEEGTGPARSGAARKPLRDLVHEDRYGRRPT